MSDAESTAHALVEEGLQLYGRGRLEEALSRWRQALALVPGFERAEEYVRYVEDNRAALEATFQPMTAGAADEAATEGAADEDLDVDVDLGELEDSSPRSAFDGRPLIVPQDEVSEAIRLPPEEGMGAGRGTRPTQDRLPRIDLDGSSPEHFGADERTPMGQVTWEMATPAPAEPQAEDHTPRLELSRWPDDVEQRGAAVGEPEVHVSVRHSMDAITRPIDLNEVQGLLEPEEEPEPAAPPEVPPRPKEREDSPRRPTPLTLLPGGAAFDDTEFDPFEPTPVGFSIPEPARMVGATQDEVRQGRPPSGGRGRAESPPSGSHDRPVAPRPAGVPQGRSRGPQVGGAASEWMRPQEPDARGAAVSSSTLLGLPTMASEVSHAPGVGATPVNEERADTMLDGARQLYEQGTFEGSLWLCQRVLALEPRNREATELLELNRNVLLAHYERQLGDLGQTPEVRLAPQEVLWHKLDHRAGFLLAQIDGSISFEDILDVSGMSRFEACRILAQLLEQRVIGLKG
ncbi:MAG: hypothetical protein IT371_01375 [Deltaproteobacteria bacterium]|nr:hypothetical protein [Deltaproteobacteria bacterium]